MKTSEAFPSNFLKASDLQGKRIVVTIDHVANEAVGREKDMKPVVYFVGKDKGLVLNKTNANKITSLLGTDEMDDWQGGQIVLFATMVEFGGEQVEGLRVAQVPMAKGKPKPQLPPLRTAVGEESIEGDDDPEVPF